MPFKQNVGGGVSAAKDTATEGDVRYPKTFHSGKGTKAKVGSILDCLIKKVTPGTSKVVIPKDSYIAEDIEIDGDPALVSANIKADTSIFGVQGDPNVVDTSDGNLSAGRMLAGTKGYSKGGPVNGEIQTLGDTSFSPSGSSAYNDCKISGATENSYVGAFDYSITGYIAGKIRIHIANLLSKNIRHGIKVGGIGGYITGSFTGDATAAAEHILAGRKAGIKGNMVNGTMTNVAAIDPAKSVTLSSGVLYARMTRGAHITNATSGYPEVSVPQKTLANAIGLTAAKLSKGQSVAGINGTANRSQIVNYIAYNSNIYYTGYSGTSGNRRIDIGAPYAEWDTIVLEVYPDTEYCGPVVIALSKGESMRVPITTIKYNDAQYRNAWLSIARDSSGKITLQPFRGNESGTYKTVVRVAAVYDGITDKHPE